MAPQASRVLLVLPDATANEASDFLLETQVLFKRADNDRDDRLNYDEFK